MINFKQFIKEGFETKHDVFYHQLANKVIDEIKNAFDIQMTYFINENLFLILLKVPNYRDIIRHIIRMFADMGITNYEMQDDGKDITIEIISISDDLMYNKNLFEKRIKLK